MPCLSQSDLSHFCLSTFSFLSTQRSETWWKAAMGSVTHSHATLQVLGHILLICVSTCLRLLLWEIRSGRGFVPLCLIFFVPFSGCQYQPPVHKCSNTFGAAQLTLSPVKRQRLLDNVKSALGVCSELTERSAFKRSAEPLCHALMPKLLQCWSNWQCKLPTNMQYWNCSNWACAFSRASVIMTQIRNVFIRSIVGSVYIETEWLSGSFPFYHLKMICICITVLFNGVISSMRQDLKSL